MSKASVMADPGEFDFDDSEIENRSEAYLAYDHPYWEKYENARREMSTTFPLNTTMQPIPSIYELNRQKSLTFYPVFIIVGCIMVFGVLFNIIVCYIYRCRSRRATSNYFVIFFAIFDMVGCLVVIPFEVSALALPFLYDVVPVCKIIGFIETWAVCAQCLTLICVAYDCYRKLCRPEKEFSVKKARLCCIVAVIVAVLMSIPALAVFGTKKVKTSQQGVSGVTCSVDQTMPLWLRIIYNLCVLGTFTFSLCVMTVLYSLIGVGWCKQRQAEERGEKPSPAKREFPKKHRFVRDDTGSSTVTNYSEDIYRLHYNQGNLSHSNLSRSADQSRAPLKSDLSRVSLKFDPSRVSLKNDSSRVSLKSDPSRVPLKYDPSRAPLKSDSSRVPLKSSSGIFKTNSLQASSASTPVVTIVQLHVKNTRQASIFTVISIIFVVTMLPFVVVMILCATTPVFNQFSSNITEIIFNLCIRSYLINYLDKPVAYIIFNVNFRKEVKLIFSTLWALCTRTDLKSEQSSRQLRRSSTMDPTRSASRTPIYRPPRSSS